MCTASSCWRGVESSGRSRRRQHPPVDEVAAGDETDMSELVSQQWVGSPPARDNVCVMMQLRAGEEVCEDVIDAAAVLCVDVDVVREGNRADLA